MVEKVGRANHGGGEVRAAGEFPIIGLKRGCAEVPAKVLGARPGGGGRGVDRGAGIGGDGPTVAPSDAAGPDDG